jgi:hydrogenase maturation protease
VGGHDGVILVDALQRGQPPGTLYVLELDRPGPDAPARAIEPHGLHPAEALHLAATLGEVCPWVRLVGCEPLTFGSEDDPVMGLSAPVATAVDGAVGLVESLIANFLDGAARHCDNQGVLPPPGKGAPWSRDSSVS